jgi:hypothetical protein
MGKQRVKTWLVLNEQQVILNEQQVTLREQIEHLGC